jgi:hypothetical protein
VARDVGWLKPIEVIRVHPRHKVMDDLLVHSGTEREKGLEQVCGRHGTFKYTCEDACEYI